jgi:hypothetical protein
MRDTKSNNYNRIYFITLLHRQEGRKWIIIVIEKEIDCHDFTPLKRERFRGQHYSDEEQLYFRPRRNSYWGLFGNHTDSYIFKAHRK